MEKFRTAIIGATGVVGQQFVVALQDHPWFELSYLAASKRSAGKTYHNALKDEQTGAVRWFCNEVPEKKVLELTVFGVEQINVNAIDILFSAVESHVAKYIEPKFAKDKPVISTASAFRYDKDVAILIPGINSEHVELVNVQRRKRKWKGFISPIPNCTTTGLAITLKPLCLAFGVKKVIMTSMQAISGAGRSPGVMALDILDNVIPYISEEEEKVQRETLKILGNCCGETIVPADIKLSCTCTRVNVMDGHTESVFVSLKKDCSINDVKEAFRNYDGGLTRLNLPSAPERMIVVKEDPFRPQPRLDRDAFGGMATTIGRIRKDNTLENGIKYVLVSHNTKMGAAKGAVLVAEYLIKNQYV